MADALNLLLGAPDVAAVDFVLGAAFRHRHDMSAAPAKKVAEIIGLSSVREAARLLLACKGTVEAALRAPDASSASMKAAVPEGTDARLAKLVAKALARALPAWREAAVMQAPSLPRLQRVSWSVSMSSGSDGARRAGVSCWPDLIADELVEPCAVSADFHFASEQPACSTPGVEFPHAATRMEFKSEGAFGKTACQIEFRA